MAFFEWLFGKRDAAEGEDERVRATIDKVIETVDPRLKAVSNARERLRPSVVSALEWAQGGIARLPPSFELSEANWSGSPLLRAFFVRPADVADALARSQDLREFLAGSEALGSETLYGILAATRVERTVLGSALQNGMLRQDVAQRTVSFRDFRVAGFTRTEAEIRRGLEDFVVEQAVLAALREISGNRERSDQLDAYRQLLQMRLRLFEQGEEGCDPLRDTADRQPADLDRLKSELAANEAELSALRSGNIGFDGVLETVSGALDRVREIVAPQRIALRLNAMNIVVGEEETNAADIELVEFSTLNPDRPRRVGFFVHFSRFSVPERKVDLDALMRSI
jgi:hypothetical protein